LLLLCFFFSSPRPPTHLPSFPTRRSSDLHDLAAALRYGAEVGQLLGRGRGPQLLRELADRGRARILARLAFTFGDGPGALVPSRSEEHTSELQSLAYLVCRLLLEKKKKNN